MLSRREENALETRQALLDSALILFVENGYADTSIEEITHNARVTKGAFYHHFPQGKKEILQILFEEQCSGVMRAIREISAQERPLWDNFVAGTELYLDLCQDKNYYRIVYVESFAILDGETWQRVDNKYILRPVSIGFKRLMDGNIIRSRPVEMLTKAFLGFLKELAMYINSADDHEQARDEASQLAQDFLNSMKVP